MDDSQSLPHLNKSASWPRLQRLAAETDGSDSDERETKRRRRTAGLYLIASACRGSDKRKSISWGLVDEQLAGGGGGGKKRRGGGRSLSWPGANLRRRPVGVEKLAAAGHKRAQRKRARVGCDPTDERLDAMAGSMAAGLVEDALVECRSRTASSVVGDIVDDMVEAAAELAEAGGGRQLALQDLPPQIAFLLNHPEVAEMKEKIAMSRRALACSAVR